MSNFLLTVRESGTPALERGYLHCISAREKMGKTTLAAIFAAATIHARKTPFVAETEPSAKVLMISVNGEVSPAGHITPVVEAACVPNPDNIHTVSYTSNSESFYAHLIKEVDEYAKTYDLIIIDGIDDVISTVHSRNYYNAACIIIDTLRLIARDNNIAIIVTYTNNHDDIKNDGLLGEELYLLCVEQYLIKRRADKFKVIQTSMHTDVDHKYDFMPPFTFTYNDNTISL